MSDERDFHEVKCQDLSDNWQKIIIAVHVSTISAFSDEVCCFFFFFFIFNRFCLCVCVSVCVCVCVCRLVLLWFFIFFMVQKTVGCAVELKV